MGTTTDYLGTRLLDHASGNAAYAHPAQLYVGLILNSGLPTKGGAYTEVATGVTPYARLAVDFTAAAADATGAEADNTALLSWTPSGEDFGDIGAIALFDGNTVGGDNMLWFAELTAVETVNDGDTFELPVGIIDLKLGGTT